MARYSLSRKQRAAIAALGIVPVSVSSVVFLVYGRLWTGITFEAASALVYFIWIFSVPRGDGA